MSTVDWFLVFAAPLGSAITFYWLGYVHGKKSGAQAQVVHFFASKSYRTAINRSALELDDQIAMNAAKAKHGDAPGPAIT